MTLQIDIDKNSISEFCRKWKVTELSFFGSVLRDDFSPGSDIDILVSFSSDAQWSLVDHVAMENELSEIFGRKVDLVTKNAVVRSENWIRRQAILESLETFYVAG